MKTMVRVFAFVMAALLLAGCTVQVQPAQTTAAASTAVATTTPATSESAVASATVETTPTPVPTEMPITALRFSSDPGSPNSRDELVKKYPEFAKEHSAKVVCFEMGWTGPVKGKDFLTPEIAKRTGFTMVYESMITNSQEELNTKLNLMVSSGEVPEIYFGGSDPYSLDVYEKLGQAGFIYDAAPYVAKYTSLSTLIKPELIKYRKTDTTGQHNWFIPTQTGRGNDLIHNAGGGLYLRKDFLDKLGMEYPTNMDQYLTYLKRCKDEIKTVNGKAVIPVVFNENLGGNWDIVSCFMPMERLSLGFDWKNNFKAYNYQYTNSPELIKAMKFLNMLYTTGLLDKEAPALKREQYAQKISSGVVASMGASWWDMNTFSDNAKTEVPDIMYVQSKPLEDASEPIQYRKWTNNVGMFSTITVSKKLDEETVNHYLAMLDYFAGLDGQVLVQAGLPGKSFEIDANGKYKFTDAFKKETGDLDWNKVSATGVYYWQQLVFNLPIFDKLRAEYPEIARKDNYASWLNRAGERDRYDPTMMPTKDYYFEAGPLEREKKKALDDVYEKLVADCLIAKDAAAVETLVNTYGAKCKELGIDAIMAERQKLVDAIDITAK